ncbi:ankyrin repeat-containing protein YAR1 [Ophiocordyceps camponoti-floridani]|uniref:Ankyrin repeat-containing protein YAR1 n=1 Tax=Ophiocordyceps camponoti-floridani TaxID=2030778 RepID=A0A8H4Q5G1_9HYPO|nr:ankyrin repeat-containing protein YAR1 [Ophiocordyceps camponoti-floridani]
MAPKLSEDEIDDIIYFSRTGETTTLLETLTTLSTREKTSPTQILNATRDDSSSTPLHMSSANGHLETTRAILALGPSVDAVNGHGNTALHWAALGGHLAVVRLLVESGASAVVVNESGQMALDMALRGDKLDVVDFFLGGKGDVGEAEMEKLGLEEGHCSS